MAASSLERYDCKRTRGRPQLLTRNIPRLLCAADPALYERSFVKRGSEKSEHSSPRYALLSPLLSTVARRYRTNDEKIIPSSPPIPPTSKFPDFQFQISFCYRGGVRPLIFFPALYTLHRLERVSTSVEIKLGEKCLRVYASGKDLAWRDSNGHRHISPSLYFFFFASHNRSSSRKFLVNSASVFLFLVSPLCFIPLYSSAPSKISFSFPLFKQTAKLSRVPPPGENKYRSSFPSSKRRGISSLRFYFPPHPCVTSPFTDLPQKSCSPPTESSRLSAGRCSI